GGRFDHVGASVKGAFGFDAADPNQPGSTASTAKASSLLERVAAGASGLALLRLPNVDAELLPSCEMVVEGDRVIIRMLEAGIFIGPTARPAENARKLLAVIADHLREGQAHLEVRGYGPAD